MLDPIATHTAFCQGAELEVREKRHRNDERLYAPNQSHRRRKQL